jgi:hypothetical protein
MIRSNYNETPTANISNHSFIKRKIFFLVVKKNNKQFFNAVPSQMLD